MAAKLYFAYGSNLWLRQMATRCPDSIYVGRGILPDYCWQINERGFANIIPRSGSCVHGLVYEVSPDDELRLDRHEGVSSGSYSKKYETIILHTAVPDLRVPVRNLARDGVLGTAGTSVLSRTMRLADHVLVYVSESFVQNGRPRDEYINRMNAGIVDATRLGVPVDFIEHVVRPKIPDRPVLRTSNRSVGRMRASPPPYRVIEPEYRQPDIAVQRRRRASHSDAPPRRGLWDTLERSGIVDVRRPSYILRTLTPRASTERRSWFKM